MYIYIHLTLTQAYLAASACLSSPLQYSLKSASRVRMWRRASHPWINDGNTCFCMEAIRTCMCMCVYVYVYYICVCICRCVCVFMYDMYVCMYVCVCVCMYDKHTNTLLACIHTRHILTCVINMYTHSYPHVYIYVLTCINTHTHTHVLTCLSTCINSHTQTYIYV